MTSELQERIARAIYESRNGHGCKPWHRQEAAHKAHYLADAAAAIKALCVPGAPEGKRQEWKARALAAGGGRDGAR